MPTSKSFLPDVNFWLAAAACRHVHHPAAKAWLDAASESLVFCRVSQMGFLRLTTNPKVLSEDVLSPRKAWEAYEKLLSDPRIRFADEPSDLERAWKDITDRGSFSQNLWTDSYLAAFAKASGCTVITFDKAFASFAGVEVFVLESTPPSRTVA